MANRCGLSDWSNYVKEDICLILLFEMSENFNDISLVWNVKYIKCILYNVVCGHFKESPCYLLFIWQIYSERYVDQMGIIGYFPATMVKETQKFKEDTVKIPTTVSHFFRNMTEMHICVFL